MPSGRLAVVTVTSAGSTAIDTAAVALSDGVQLSTACTVKFDVPYAVGVPLITPVALSMDNPAGSVPPLMLHA